MFSDYIYFVRSRRHSVCLPYSFLWYYPRVAAADKHVHAHATHTRRPVDANVPPAAINLTKFKNRKHAECRVTFTVFFTREMQFVPRINSRTLLFSVHCDDEQRCLRRTRRNGLHMISWLRNESVKSIDIIKTLKSVKRIHKNSLPMTPTSRHCDYWSN